MGAEITETEKKPEKIINIENLRVTFQCGKEAVRGVSFELYPGELLALVGESGSGKTALCRSLLGLSPDGAKITFDVLERPALNKMSLIMQDAMTSLDPAMPVGKQITEGNKIYRPNPEELLSRVGIDNPNIRKRQYPGEFSGGMRQRAAAAVALAMRPEAIFADEPTTSLDADIRIKIMELISKIRTDGAAVLFVTHDLSLVKNFADRVMIMKDGKIIEKGETAEIFANPREEYSKELIRHSSESYKFRKETTGKHSDTKLIEIKKLSKYYPLGYGRLNCVFKDVDFDIYEGETTGLCGASGIGKSTLARCIAGLEKPSGGERYAKDGLSIQMIFQDCSSAFNPRMTVGQIIAEPVYLADKQRPPREAILELMGNCGLEPELINRRSRELSGGQRQRVAIARAVAAKPGLIIADEPFSSLDVIACGKIIRLLKRLKEEHNLTMLLISHDLNLLENISGRIIRMS